MSQVAIAKDLVALGNDVLFAFRRASGAFARYRDEFQILSPSEAACKAELQRFQLWVISLGLFQSSHNSLDYRLRQNETVRSMIAALLTDLCLALDDLFDELSRDTNKNSGDAKELEPEIHSGTGANVEARSFQSVDRSELSDCSSGKADEENLTTMYMDDVIEINDELMKIAMQIRSPSSRKPRHKTYPSGGTELDDQHVYTNVLKSFRKKGIEQTLLSARLRRLSIDRAEASPVLRDSDEFLVDRLSKANDFRRQQFEYWRKYRSHSVRATTSATGAADADDSHDKVQPRAILTPTADDAFVRSDQKTPKTLSMPSVSLLAPDSKLRSVRSAGTHQSRALTVHTPSGDLIAWPEVPSSIPIGKEFECPLCFFICPQEQRTGEPWRIHLKHDLCPYICTFPDCSQPDTLYESRDQWIQHEQWSHTCFWRCPKDDIEFEDRPSYEIHVIAQHPVAAEKNPLLSEGVLATQRFLAKQPSRSCPFCDVDLDSVGEMYDHIGSHLETVALLAIPQLDDRELQPNSDAASLVAAGKDADGSRKNDFDETLPVVFPENDDSDECSPAEQGLSGSDFEFHLARVPEQVLNQSVWMTNVIRSDVEDPAPHQSSQQGMSAVPSVSSPRKPFQTRNLQQDERLSGHWQTAKLPCFMMDNHARNQDFYCRKGVLAALDNVLLPSQHRQFDTEKGRHAVLCGMGGIGKTSIAVEFAFSRGDHFDAVFWVNAATLPKLEHSFAEIAVKLGLVDTWESSDHVILRELVKGWLENPQKPVIDDNHAMIQVEAHWLLIFDGADQPEILHDYWPLPSTGSILTTSRDPLSKSIKRYTAVGIDLLSLEDEESAALLWRLCPENDGHIRADAILSLARMSGGIPLMICRMAGFIRHHKLTFAYYLSRCRINPGLLDRLSDGVGASTWSTVMEELEPKPRALLEICAVLGANKIEERIFTSSIPDKDILSGLLLSKSTYISARSTVLRTSLIQHNSNSDEIYVHPIIQGLVWSKISLNRKSVVLSATILLIFRTWEPTSIYQRHMDLTPEDRSQLVPHVIQLERLVQGMNVNLGAPRRIPVAAESGLRSTSPFIKPPGPETPATEGIEFAKLMVDAIWWLNERGRFSETEPLVARAMCLSESRSDKEFLEIYFDTLYLWTDIINKTNRVTPAPDLQWHLLETALKISGHTSFGIFLAARAYNQVGIALCLTDKFANGIKKFIISIEKHDEATPKPEGGIDIEPKVNMALAYWRLGDLARAEEILQGTIDNFDNWEARYGTMNGYFQGRILHAWGNFYHHQGRFNVSAGLHERALQQYEAKFGKDHHKTADMCHKVAQHYILRAEYERARMLIDQGLGIWQREERFHQPELARTTYLKAILAEKCGNKEEAARLTKTAREMRNRVPHATVKTDKEPLTEGDFDEIVAFFAR